LAIASVIPGGGASEFYWRSAVRKTYFPCPLCGGNADVTHKPTGEVLIGCFSDSCRRLGGSYLPELCEALGLPRNASKEAIAMTIEASPTSRKTSGTPAVLPSRTEFRAWARALLSGCPALAYLQGQRGLSQQAIKGSGLGWDEEEGCIVIPFFLNGDVVAFKTCEYERGPAYGHAGKLHKPYGSGTWGWPLYRPKQPPTDRTWLVEGEWDALRLVSAGVPAMSVSGGKDQWRDSWADQLQGLRVEVMFDVGAEAEARKAVRALRQAGVDAADTCAQWLGLLDKGDDVSDYLRRNQGNGPSRLNSRLAQ
jgi:hypothetical protein